MHGILYEMVHITRKHCRSMRYTRYAISSRMLLLKLDQTSSFHCRIGSLFIRAPKRLFFERRYVCVAAKWTSIVILIGLCICRCIATFRTTRQQTVWYRPLNFHCFCCISFFFFSLFCPLLSQCLYPTRDAATAVVHAPIAVIRVTTFHGYNDWYINSNSQTMVTLSQFLRRHCGVHVFVLLLICCCLTIAARCGYLPYPTISV